MNEFRRKAGSFSDEDEPALTQLEGMQVEFDEKVTLFPVELEEVRELSPAVSRRAVRGRPLH